MISKSNNKKTIEEVINTFAAAEPITATQSFKMLSSAFSQNISDDLLTKVVDLIREKLCEARFDLYLNLSSRFTSRQMQPKNNGQFLNRLYAPIKADVKEALAAIDTNVVPMLDLLKDNKETISRWLLSTGNRDTYIVRAKLCYIYIALKLDKRQVFDFERLLLSSMEKDSILSFDKYIGKLFPEVLLSKSPFGQLEKLAYFHHKDAEAADELSIKLIELQLSYSSVLANNADLRNENISVKEQLISQKKLIGELENEIVSLKLGVESAKDRLEYETRKLVMDTEAFQTAFTDKIKRRLATEIEGIQTTLLHVGEPEKSRLQRRISNIESILADKER